MEASLEPKSKRVIRHHARPNAGPRHCYTRAMVKIGTAKPEQDMMPLVQKVAQRIRSNRHSYEGAGSYVLADGTGSVFVLCEAATSTAATVDANTGQLVGRYSFPLPSPRDLFDDLLAHFVEIGFVTETLIRDVIREVEG